MVEKFIAITESQNNWVQSQLDAGRYASESELFGALIGEKQQVGASEQKSVIRDFVQDNAAVLVSGGFALAFFIAMLWLV